MRIALSILFILLLVPGYSGIPQRALWSPPVDVTAKRVALFSDAPGRKQLGELTYLGGVELHSSDPAFGGFSSMTLDRDGRFTLLNDGGNWLRMRLDSNWQVQQAQTGTLPGGPGTGWRKAERDSESMTRDPETGARWVGFESANEIMRYDDDFTRSTGWVQPIAMAEWPENGGAESMVRLHDGRFIVLSETGNWPHAKGRAAICFSGDPVAAPNRGFRFAYRPPKGYSPSDAVELPGNRLLVLNRELSLRRWFTAKLTIVPIAAIAPGRLVTGREIASFESPALHDNFEALAVTHEKGRVVIWIASDDNQSLFQKSYLLKFALPLPPR